MYKHILYSGICILLMILIVLDTVDTVKDLRQDNRRIINVKENDLNLYLCNACM